MSIYQKAFAGGFDDDEKNCLPFFSSNSVCGVNRTRIKWSFQFSSNGCQMLRYKQATNAELQVLLLLRHSTMQIRIIEMRPEWLKKAHSTSLILWLSWRSWPALISNFLPESVQEKTRVENRHIQKIVRNLFGWSQNESATQKTYRMWIFFLVSSHLFARSRKVHSSTLQIKIALA